MTELPVILLVFANEQGGPGYLRNLPEELRTLSAILDGAEARGLCRLVVIPNATLDEVFAAFLKHRDRVVVFHYAGHADSGRLLLESNAPDGAGAAANAEGLASFLGHCHGLQLVFLNGCSTRAQSARLLDGGVACVIATARAIEDAIARDFAAAFYTELAAGMPLRMAYDLARDQVLTARGKAPAAYYQDRHMSAAAVGSDGVDPTDDNGFPWEFRSENKLAQHWNLPDAAGNPLFGLPDVPALDLPESPFRHLTWFTAEHAEVFFGRGYQIRSLYERITDKSGSPILLLYGASGVGKSSLLDAGVVPRLKAGGHEVRYRRRDPKLGLLATLAAVVAADGPATPLPLGEAWHAEEARLNRPLVILLDQVEEVYTRSDTADTNELDLFIAALVPLFRVRDRRPRGKLVLGFRKEWFAEIDRRVVEAGLDRTREFLEPLDRRGVIEAVTGPARQGRLQDRYRLRVEDGLPERIAGDLLADAGSALASTLQVLLSKMWDRVKDADAPVFDRKLYETLKAGGYLLKDVLEEGLQEVGRWNAEVLSSGLALDVLAFHATDLGTAAQVNQAELRTRYAHRLDMLDGLIARCKDLYLLIEADPLPDTPGRPTRMAHDLIAPLVLQRFRLSVAPGQRARRLLENRVPDWSNGKTGPDLDRPDLSSVVEGAPGMRAWTPDEVRLVEASRAEDKRIREQEAQEARWLREAEEGRLEAEARARKEAEQSLEIEKRANTRMQQAAYVLLGLVAVMLVVAGAALRERSEAQRNLANLKVEEKVRALTQAKELLDAEPQAVRDILSAVRASGDAMNKVREMRSAAGSTGKQRARAALALLDKQPSEAEFLLQHVLAAETDPQELLLVRGYLAPYLTRGTADDLWKKALSSKSTQDLQLRHAAVLVALGGKDARWEKAASPVVANLLSVDALQLRDWKDALDDVKPHLIAPLVQKFEQGEPNERVVAATILNDYAAERIDLILDLLKDADAGQFAILIAKARDHREPAVKSMTEEVARSPAPRSGFAEKDRQAGRKANALITLALLGKPGPLWPALRAVPDPRLRTNLIQRIGTMGVQAALLTDRLFIEKDPSVRAAIVMALGEYPYDVRVGEIKKRVADRLLAEYPLDPDPGFHSAIAWLLPNLMRLDCEDADRALAEKPADSKQGWFVNKQGQTFVILAEPGVSLMGSPEEEAALGRASNEWQHARKIPRSFAISTREVTGEEFYKFLSTLDPKDVTYNHDNQRDYCHDPTRGPIVGVTWFEAARYCRWLGDNEKIPESEQCYPPVSEIKENMVLPQNYLTRTGYRLPTEAEWEYACRAGTATPWVFGSDRSLLKEFGWHLNNSGTKNLRQQAQTACQKKPNPFGLFDMHGNVYEWCFDRVPTAPAKDALRADDEENERPDRKVVDADLRIYRGGSFGDLALNLRSAYRDTARPTNRFPGIGFRLVRTYPPNVARSAGELVPDPKAR